MEEDLKDLEDKIKMNKEKEANIVKEIEELKNEQKVLKDNSDSNNGKGREKYFEDKKKQMEKERDKLVKQIAKLREEKNQLEIKIDEDKSDI